MPRILPQWILDKKQDDKSPKKKARVASKKPPVAKEQLVELNSSDEHKEEEKTQAFDVDSSDEWEQEPKSVQKREQKPGKPRGINAQKTNLQLEIEALDDEEPGVIRDDLQEPEVVDGNRKDYEPWVEHLKALRANKDVERDRFPCNYLAEHWCRSVIEQWLRKDVKNLLQQYKEKQARSDEEEARYKEIDEFRRNLVECKRFNSSYFKLSYWQYVFRAFQEEGMTMESPIPDLSEIVIEVLNKQARDYRFQLEHGLRQTALETGLYPHREKFLQWKKKHPKFTAACRADDSNMFFLS